MAINLDPFEAVLLDLDGTIYHEDHALPGAVELIHRLQREGRPYACLTNSTSSPQRLSARLLGMGVTVEPSHIYTAAAAAADYIAERFAGPHLPAVFNLATEGVVDLLSNRVRWTQSADEPCDAVIVGVPLSVYATQDRQRTAMLLLRKGAAHVSICADRVYPSPRGLEFGVGALSAMLAYASGATPVYCGKPEKLFFYELCRRLNVKPDRCILIGDNLESDIAGGRGVGMHTVLVLGGVSSIDDVAAADESLRPHEIIDHLGKL